MCMCSRNTATQRSPSSNKPQQHQQHKALPPDCSLAGLVLRGSAAGVCGTMNCVLRPPSAEICASAPILDDLGCGGGGECDVGDTGLCLQPLHYGSMRVVLPIPASAAASSAKAVLEADPFDALLPGANLADKLGEPRSPDSEEEIVFASPADEPERHRQQQQQQQLSLRQQQQQQHTKQPVMRPQPVRPQPMRPQPVRAIRPQPETAESMRLSPEPSPEPVKPQAVRPQAVRPQAVRPQPMRPQPMRPQPMRPQPVRLSPEPSPVLTCGSEQQPPSRTELLRPEISSSDVEAFYREAHELGFAGTAVHAAVMESHEWHRRWTMQEEVGHTMPEEDRGDVAIPELYAYKNPYDTDDQMDFRAGGAKNPSPFQELASELSSQFALPIVEEYDPQQQEQRNNKRGRVSTFDELGMGREEASPNVDELPPMHLRCSRERQEGNPSSISSLSAEEISQVQQDKHLAKQPRREMVDMEAFRCQQQQLLQKQQVSFPPSVPPSSPPLDPPRPEELEQVQSEAPPTLIRPVALRIAKPVAVRPTAMLHPSIPTDVFRRHQQGNREHDCISPLTFDSGSTSKSAPSSKKGNRRQPSSLTMQDPVPTDCPMTCGPKEQQQPQPHLIEEDQIPTEILRHLSRSDVRRARDGVLEALAAERGETTDNEVFQKNLDVLEEHFQTVRQQEVQVGGAARLDPHAGLWLTLTKPTFFGCLGDNDNGDPMYTLGRMSFDMFAPVSMVCSLQGCFNVVEEVAADDETVPAELREVEKKTREGGSNAVLQTYNVVTAFTVEPSLAAYPNAPNRDVRRPIRGIMTTYGYTLLDPDPKVTGRQTIWITGGRVEPNDCPEDRQAWNELYRAHPPKQTGLGAKAKSLAIKLLVGAEVPTEVAADGSMEYAFKKPLGGHGKAYVDVMYVDKTLRILQGHRGTIFVFSRVAEGQEHSNEEKNDSFQASKASN